MLRQDALCLYHIYYLSFPRTPGSTCPIRVKHSKSNTRRTAECCLRGWELPQGQGWLPISRISREEREGSSCGYRIRLEQFQCQGKQGRGQTFSRKDVQPAQAFYTPPTFFCHVDPQFFLATKTQEKKSRQQQTLKCLLSVNYCPKTIFV